MNLSMALILFTYFFVERQLEDGDEMGDLRLIDSPEEATEVEVSDGEGAE